MSTSSEQDPLDSPSAAVRTWIASRRWHPVTWLIVVAGLLHLVGDIVMSAFLLAQFLETASPSHPLADTLAQILHMIGYSLWFFGTAATVEYLFRIWTELRLRREGARKS